ncbi:Hypothetical predicted protein [Pelobates cultripes]|uniref:Uncharacterized protein n=1 Tax=Pelobates cultripes TaxID=61616 RepID=A0AAD1VQJ7_PELCU|nr:Hypothetical predicted protein [Pelobates cultripes]
MNRIDAAFSHFWEALEERMTQAPTEITLPTREMRPQGGRPGGRLGRDSGVTLSLDKLPTSVPEPRVKRGPTPLLQPYKQKRSSRIRQRLLKPEVDFCKFPIREHLGSQSNRLYGAGALALQQTWGLGGSPILVSQYYSTACTVLRRQTSALPGLRLTVTYGGLLSQRRTLCYPSL